MSDYSSIKVSAPGRICLFGEHQDYLGLRVISAAINRRISVSGEKNDEKSFDIELPDIGCFEKIYIEKENALSGNRDYLRSSFKVLQRKGLDFPFGYRCRIESSIPIGKGVSSSSALVVAWIRFLISVSGTPDAFSGFDLAKLAFSAEVEEFNEPGGMQDHLCAVYGSTLFMDFNEDVKVTKLPKSLSGFVLGDSCVAKDTIGVLSRIKRQVSEGMNILKKDIPDFKLISSPLEILETLRKKIPADIYSTIDASMRIRDLTLEAKNEIEKGVMNESKIGTLFDRHHEILRDGLLISTPDIERMIESSGKAGALGCKINGSGGGGCFIAYCPGREEEVVEAINREGGKAQRISIDEGVKADAFACN